MSAPESKRCTQCGEEMPLDAFAADRTKKDGRRGRCRECDAAYRAAYRAAAEERNAAYRAAAKARNKAQNAAAYRAANKERVREYDAAWYASNKESKRAYHAAYHASNKEAIHTRKASNKYGPAAAAYLVRNPVPPCNVCGRLCDRAEGGESTPHVDHDHACCPDQRSCGACVRGIVCQSCNVRLIAGADAAHARGIPYEDLLAGRALAHVLGQLQDWRTA